MIREHEFNSRWWGGRAGVLDRLDFFELSDAEQKSALEAFEWVELRAPLEDAPLAAIQRSGFFQVDVQIPFRIALSRVPSSPSLSEFTVERASETPFTIADDELAPFDKERYRHLPGVTPERLTRRYGQWSRLLLESDPAWCLRISSNGRVQGWFLSQNTRDGLALELAMLHREGTISGTYVYQKALLTYAADARLGFARFSVANPAVLNIYARFGAQFFAPAGSWFWIRTPSASRA